MKPEARRNYSMTDAELALFSSNLVQKMTRDQAEFALKGILLLDIQAFETLENTFEIFPDDVYYQQIVVQSQQEKNGLRESLEMKIREIIGVARVKWGRSSPQVRRFGQSDMTKLDDGLFLRRARLTKTVAEDFLADLSSYGLTQAQIDAMSAETQDFEDALNDVDKKKYERDYKTQERIDLGNEVYAKVAEYCEIGKIIWQDVDESRYSDYIIYPELPNLPGKITGLVYNIPTGALTWNADEKAVNYEVAFAPDIPEPIFINIYEGPATSYTYDPGGPDNYLFQVRGINAMNEKGPWSDILTVVRS